MGAPVFHNTYSSLPDKFYTRLHPTPVGAPQVFALNQDLAKEMGLDVAWLESDAGTSMLSGNAMPDGADPIAQVYAGHQFGGWSPQLGDGRAHLLGEVEGPDTSHWDIQLKGSGQTPYSRMGDGRAWLGPVIREYIVSEAMHALSIPTTRALAAVQTGEMILREGPKPGAIVARVAPSHIRVGTFQYFASIGDKDALKELLSFTIARHYQDLDPDDALGFLKALMYRQADLIAKWMGVGFIHGVMNTDNTHVGGLTIDYGPCAFMDNYHPAKVFSSIDQFGRYAYQAQPEIIAWNLAQLASALLPIINDDADKAVEAAQSVLNEYGLAYTQAWKSVFLAKFGLSNDREGDIALVQNFLSRMAAGDADFTRTFRALATEGDVRAEFSEPVAFDTWLPLWQDRIKDEKHPHELMTKSNPAFIPRNHRIEEAIQASLHADLEPFQRLIRVLKSPFDDQPGEADLQEAPESHEEVTQTFCGT